MLDFLGQNHSNEAQVSVEKCYRDERKRHADMLYWISASPDFPISGFYKSMTCPCFHRWLLLCVPAPSRARSVVFFFSPGGTRRARITSCDAEIIFSISFGCQRYIVLYKRGNGARNVSELFYATLMLFGCNTDSNLVTFSFKR
jgi:hypothetical protein